MAVAPSDSAIIGNETEPQDTNKNTLQNLENVINNNDEEESMPVVVSLDGEMMDAIPDFVYESEDSSSENVGPNQFAPAAVDPEKPNITAIYYQNMTNGDEGWVTWMQPGGTVKIWFQVKGPITLSYPTILVQFRSVVTQNSDYGSYFVEASLNSWEIGANETQWFSWTIVLPDEEALTYGWGSGKCNAFTLSLYQPLLIIPPQAFEVFYGGLDSKYSYLHMFGEVQVSSLNWYNYTYGPTWVPCQIAERNWIVFPEFEYYVVNAPVWDIEIRSDMRRDIVWWPDETIIPYDSSSYTRLEPGAYVYQPKITGSWVGWLLEEPWDYGSLIGQTRGLYMKFHLHSGVSWSEIYSSNDEGHTLLLVEGILAQPPQIEILTPMDAEVISQTSVSFKAMISDPNSNYQITDVQLFVNGVSISVTHLYNQVTGIIETPIVLPESTGSVNITLVAMDSTGLIGKDAIIVTTDNPLDYFPASYTSTYQHIEKVLVSQVFEWEFPLEYSPSNYLKIELTPNVEVGFDTTLGFDIYHSRPSEVFAGDDFSTYVSVSDPIVTCSMWMTVGIDYDITLNGFWTVGTIILYDELWSASKTIQLGNEILDLRYDLPGISEYIQKFTHYRIGFLDMIPLIGDFASIDLIVDVIPLLKISNVISADITGTDCTPDRDAVTFVSDKMFAITSTVDSDASGGTAEVLLNDVNLETTVGLDLCVNLTLTGAIVGITLANIDLNQWLYDNLGISVPILSLWNSKSTLPLVSQIALDVNVANQELEVGMTGIFADEDFINVDFLLEDERENGVAAGTVTASVDSVSCTVTEGTNGEYTVLVPYRSTAFTLDVSFSKSGYIGSSDSFDIYIDPIIVDSTSPSIASISATPNPPTSDESVSVTASIVDTLTGVVNPTLFYSINSGSSWASTSMSVISGTTYEGIIPSQIGGVTVIYYIQASDGAGNDVSSGQESYTVSADATTTTTTTTSTTTTTTTGTTSTTTTGTSTTDTTSTTSTGTGTPTDSGGIMLIALIGSVGAIGVIIVVVFIIKKKN